MSPPTLGFVLPCLDEAPSLPAILAALSKDWPGCTMVVVDDGSTDGSPAIARSAGARVVDRGRRRGLASAIHEGIAACSADRIVVMDADGSHRTRDAGALITALDDADLAVGSRWVLGGSAPGLDAKRTAWSRASNALVRTVLDGSVADWTSGFWAIRGAAAKHLTERPPIATGWLGSLEIKWRARRAGLSIVELPVVFEARTHGASKLRLRDAAAAARDLLRIRFAADP